MRALVESQIAARTDARLARELLDAYAEAKRNFYLGGLRLSAVEGGRFCEAAFRILEQLAFAKFTAIGKALDTEKLIRALNGLGASAANDSVRLHVPRALRVIYDIRNKRDAAHLADGIDPNLQDASLVIGILDWVLAEFVRLFHNVPPDEARVLVEALVSRQVPIVQEFSGQPKVLSPHLSASDYLLVLVYHRGLQGASFEQLRDWARPTMRANLRRTLTRLADEEDLLHLDGNVYKITRLGEQYVESNRLLEPT